MSRLELIPLVNECLEKVTILPEWDHLKAKVAADTPRLLGETADRHDDRVVAECLSLLGLFFMQWSNL